eukprot:s2895_g2.t1
MCILCPTICHTPTPAICQAKSKHAEDPEESETASDEGVEEGESKHVKYASDDEGSEESNDDAWFNDMCESQLKVMGDEEGESPSDGLPLDIDIVESQWRLEENQSPRPIEDPRGDAFHDQVVEGGESGSPIVVDVPESPPCTSGDPNPSGLADEEKAAHVRMLKMKLRSLELELQSEELLESMAVTPEKKCDEKPKETQEHQVVTRRQQLGLKVPTADEQGDEDANKIGRGGGRGRGRGRGRGGRKGKGRAESSVPATEDQQPVVPAGKRLPESQTPERRKLETELDKAVDKEDEEKEEPLQTSPPIKQSKKKPRKTTKTETPSQPAGNSAEPAPKAKAKARAKAKGKAKGKAKPTEPTEVDQKDEKVGDQENGAKPEPSVSDKAAEVTEAKQPSKRMQKLAHDQMVAAKSDPATKFHLEKLFEACSEAVERSKFIQPYEFWQCSMYYKTYRVGLLQKRDGRFVHVTSFGLPACPNIAVKYLGGDKASDKIMDTSSDEAVRYKDALVDLVKTVGVMMTQGKNLQNFVA